MGSLTHHFWGNSTEIRQKVILRIWWHELFFIYTKILWNLLITTYMDGTLNESEEELSFSSLGKFSLSTVGMFSGLSLYTGECWAMRGRCDHVGRGRAVNCLRVGLVAGAGAQRIPFHPRPLQSCGHNSRNLDPRTRTSLTKLAKKTKVYSFLLILLKTNTSFS